MSKRSEMRQAVKVVDLEIPPLQGEAYCDAMIDAILDCLMSPDEAMENSGQEEFERLGSDACRVWRTMVKTVRER